jgi:transcriptional regulator with XRE-family HTH domain
MYGMSRKRVGNMYDTLYRIVETMKFKGITDTEIEMLLGVPKGTFSNWKRGKSRSYYEHIDVIADRIGVSIDYLIRGSDKKPDLLSKQEEGLLEGFRKLSDEAKDVVLKNVRLLA